MNKGYNTTRKVMQFHPSNLLKSSACSSMLWIHTDDAMKPLECSSVNTVTSMLLSAPVAQFVEHRALMWEAVSLTPAGPTLKVLKN